MKKVIIFVVTILCVFTLTTPALSQVTNLLINGSSTSFSMTSGDVVDWTFNLPVGGVAIGELWLDLNGNHAIDPGTDRILFQFSERDGDTLGIGGPPDMDGLVNGAVHLHMGLGLPPQDYVMKFTNNGVGESVWGTVAHLSPPAFTVSGTVSGPPGADLRYIAIEASVQGQGSVAFWDGLTDSLGLYTIELNSDTAGNPWHISMNSVPSPYTVSPQDTNVTIDGNITGVNFTLLGAAAQVFGYLIDDAGDSLAFTEVGINRNDTSGSFISHYGQTDASGRFWFGIPSGELNGLAWNLKMPYTDQPIGTHILGFAQLPVLHDGDSLAHDLMTYSVNSSIDGFFQFDGAPPGYSIRLFAANSDSGESFVWTDSASGSFSIPVSDKIADYHLEIHDYFGPYFYPNVTAHPGETGVIYNITTTGVAEGPGGIPTGYALGQNYPNPFNPTTTIPYAIPSRSHVVLTVYDVLGREVARLVNEVEEPGAKLVIFNASSLPSGVYTYRIISGTFAQSRKLLILK